MTEIKDCPFCESSRAKVIMHDSNHYAVTCYDCDARGPAVQYYPPDGEGRREILAVDRWNARSKIGQGSVMCQFLMESKRRQEAHIDCICDACMKIKHNIFMDRINARLLNAIEDKKND